MAQLTEEFHYRHCQIYNHGKENVPADRLFLSTQLLKADTCLCNSVIWLISFSPLSDKADRLTLFINNYTQNHKNGNVIRLLRNNGC